MSSMYASLYIHVPVCIQKCSYCDFFSIPIHKTPAGFSFESFVTALLNEINLKMRVYAADGFSTVYIGGGTPSLLPAKNVAALCGGLRRLAPGQDFLRAKKPGRALSAHAGSGSECAARTEWTVEMNPGDVTQDALAAWAGGGANRLSLGIQSFNEKTLASVRRRNSPEENYRALDAVSREWRGGLSVDLIAGLPFQTEQSVLHDLSSVLEFSPEHVSLYQLSLEERTPLFSLARNKKAAGRGGEAAFLPSEDEAADMWLAGKDFLEARGFVRYETSNFALPGFESKHNETYWRLNSFIGAGPGSAGTLVAGNRCFRFDATRDIDRWLSFWRDFPVDAYDDASALLCGGEAETDRPVRFPPDAPVEISEIPAPDFAFETIMMGMRLSSGMSNKDFHRRFGADMFSFVGKTLEKWMERGMLVVDGDNVRMTEEGSLFLNAFLVDCAAEIDTAAVNR